MKYNINDLYVIYYVVGGSGWDDALSYVLEEELFTSEAEAKKYLRQNPYLQNNRTRIMTLQEAWWEVRK